MSVIEISLLLSALAARLFVFGYEPYCHEDSRPGLHFNDLTGPATLAIGFENQYMEMECCTTGFTQITWYQTTDGGQTWKDFTSVTTSSREVIERGQVVRFQKLDSTVDSGSYKCVAVGHDEGERIENVIQLEIRNYSSWSKTPRWLDPQTAETGASVSTGDSITIPCSSFSGTNCVTDDPVCLHGWYRKHSDDPSQHVIISDNTSARVHKTYEYRVEMLKMISILSIADFNDDDFGTYACFSMNENGDSGDRNVVLRRRQDPTVVTPIIAGVVGGVAVAILFTGFLVTGVTRIDLDVRIWLAERRLKSATGNDAQQDVLFLHSGHHQLFASYIKRSLQTKYQLTVFSVENLEAGRAVVSGLAEAARASRSVLVLLTPDLTSDDEMIAVIGDIISDITPVFISYGIDSTDNSVGFHLDRNIRGAMEVSRPIYWPGAETVGLLENQTESKHNRGIRIFFKTLRLSLLEAMTRARPNAKGNYTSKAEREKPSLWNNPGPYIVQA